MFAGETWDIASLAEEQMDEENIRPVFQLKKEIFTRPEIKKICHLSSIVKGYCHLGISSLTSIYVKDYEKTTMVVR